MTDIDVLKRRRGILKGHFTRQETFIDSYDISRKVELPVRMTKTNDWFEQFEIIQGQIEESDSSPEQLTERDLFSER